MEKIIIFKEKHEDDIYNASTQELMLRAMFKKIQERFEMGWYHYEEINLESEYPLATVEASQLTMLSEAAKKVILALANIDKEKIERKRPYQTEAKRDYELFEKIVNCTEDEAIKRTIRYRGKIMPTIEYLMISRMDGEYEGYSVEKLSI